MSIIETLAALEHDQWRTWAHRLLATEPNLSKERKEGWESLMCDYDDLPEEWKEYDRAWALKVYEAVIHHSHKLDVDRLK